MKDGEIIEAYLCVDIARVLPDMEGFNVYTYKVPIKALDGLVQGPLDVNWTQMQVEESAEKI